MQYRKEKSGYWLILGKGEEVKSAIEDFARRKGVKGAKVWGIGAVEGAVLGYFNKKSKKYEERAFPGTHELLSCIGNINEDGLHAHMVISGADFIARGGHMISARISVFGEFFILPAKPLCKAEAPEFMLKRIDLEKQ